jgi:catechol 2,3-dioxygenase-like lactoylglutathione lyase family enzyme
MKLNHINLTVSDVQETRDSLKNTWGCRVWRAQGMTTLTWGC